MPRLDPRDRYLRRTYGLTSAQFVRMIRAQKGLCAICRYPPKPGKRLNVDHDHKTKRVRGGLCWRCNYRLLGRGRENPALHEAAAKYLRATIDWRNTVPRVFAKVPA